MNDAAYRRIGIQVIIHTAPVLARADVAAAAGEGRHRMNRYLTIVQLPIYLTP